MPREDYNKYLNSSHWADFKKLKAASCAKVCKVCGTDRKIHLHHMRYRENLEDVRLKDTCWLCEACHTAFHKRYKSPPTWNKKKMESKTVYAVKKQLGMSLSTKPAQQQKVKKREEIDRILSSAPRKALSSFVGVIVVSK